MNQFKTSATVAEMAGMQSQDQRAFLRALAQTRTDAEYTDFTIVSDGKEFKIHKVILSLHSKYFDKLFKSEYKEANDNRISLIDDPPLAVSCMMQYFYQFSYKPEPGTYIEPRPSIVLTTRTGFDAPLSPVQTVPSLVQVHAWIYTIAEKYDIPGLKTLAKANFTKTAHNMLLWKPNQAPQPAQLQAFYDVIPYIYSNTAPNEMGLRQSIVEVWASAKKVVYRTAKHDKWQELVERFPELGADMIMGLVGDVLIDCKDDDSMSYCSRLGDYDDGQADYTNRGGWGREEEQDDRDDGPVVDLLS